MYTGNPGYGVYKSRQAASFSRRGAIAVTDISAVCRKVLSDYIELADTLGHQVPHLGKYILHGARTVSAGD